MTTDAPIALPADGCPEPEQLAAFIDGGLPPAERTAVERHLFACEDCRGIVADTVATPALIPAARPARTLAKWIAAGGGLVAAAAALVLMLGAPGEHLYVSEMAPLVRVVSAHRAVESRLAGFPYAPPPVVTRGAADTAANAELAARAD